MKRRKLSMMMGLLMAWLPVSGVVAGKLYRWVDENGKVHYTDSLPPQQAGEAHEELNPQGVTVKEVSKAKTREEIAREQEIERLREEQRKLAEKQNAEDQVLLNTFRNEEDILMSRNGQLAAIDAQVAVIDANVKRHKKRLSALQQDAANYENSGKPVPKQVLANIGATHKALDESYQTVIAKEHDKDRIRKKFASDLQRFNEIKKFKPSQEAEKDLRLAPLESRDYLLYCPESKDCEAPWKRVEAFVRKYSTTSLQMSGDNIFMSSPPRDENDLSITVSKIREPQNPGVIIFMDLQCKDTPKGKEQCQGDKARDVRKSFKPALTGTVE